MQTLSLKKNKPSIILTVFWMAMIFIFTWFSPRYLDDIVYTYYIPLVDSDNTPFRYMDNIGDLLESQWNHYLTVNGRFVVHMLVQFFCGFAGKFWFSLVNAAVWCCVPFLMLKLTGHKAVSIKSELSCMLLMLLVFNSLPFTPAFQINYVWTALFNLVWLYMFLYGKSTKPWQVFLIALWSIVVGNCNESFSLSMCAAIIVYAVYKKFHLELRQWIGGIFYGVGTLTILCSPGFWLRVETHNEGGMNQSIAIELAGFITRLLPNLCVVLLLIAVVLFCRNYIEKCNREKTLRLVGYTVAVTCFILAIIMHDAAFERVLIAANIFLSLIIISYLRNGAFPKGVLYSLSIVAVIGMSCRYWYVMESAKIDDTIRDQYVESSDGVIYLPDKEFSKYTWNKVHGFTAEAREFMLLYPDKPILRVHPESMRGIRNDRDTNMVVKLDDQAWLIVQSKSKPVEVVLNKTILPGVVDRKMGVRHIDLSDGFEQTFDSTDFWRAGIYVNTRPYIVSDISVDSGK